jgi:hypothetical protein
MAVPWATAGGGRDGAAALDAAGCTTQDSRTVERSGTTTSDLSLRRDAASGAGAPLIPQESPLPRLPVRGGHGYSCSTVWPSRRFSSSKSAGVTSSGNAARVRHMGPSSSTHRPCLWEARTCRGSPQVTVPLWRSNW